MPERTTWALNPRGVDWTRVSDTRLVVGPDRPPEAGWPEPGTRLRTQLDDLYWGEEHLAPVYEANEDGYCVPILETSAVVAGLYCWRDDEEGADKVRHFAESWRLFRLGLHPDGLDLARRRALPHLQEAELPLGTILWRIHVRRPAGVPPRALLVEAVRVDEPTASGYAMRQLQEASRRRWGTPQISDAMRALMSSAAYRQALLAALDRVAAEGVGAGRGEALLVGGPSDGRRVPQGEPPQAYIHTAVADWRTWVRLSAEDPLTPLPTHHYRRSGHRLPDGTHLYEYEPPA